MRNRKPCAAPTLLHHTLNRVCTVSILRRVGLLLLLGLLLAGCGPSTMRVPMGGNSRATPTRSFAGLIDIGSGRKLYLECHGSGSPTVILDSRLDAAADVWISYQAHPSLAVFAKSQASRGCAPMTDRANPWVTT